MADEIPPEGEPDEQAREHPRLVVGLGASAGGLEALQDFLAALVGVHDVAFVVVQHLDPNAKNLLPDLLASASPLPVEEIVDGTALLPGRVYVAPAHAVIQLERGRLRVAMATPDDRRTTIDACLTSLAQAYGARSVGIVLSGSGSDGTLGLQAIASVGGITMAQDDESARFDAMPSNAIASGVVDRVLTPTELAEEISALAEYHRRGPPLVSASSIQARLEEVMPEICRELERSTSYGLHQYKPSTLLRRIMRRMQMLRMPDPEAYLARLRQDDDEAALLLREVLIGVTAFFRDPDAFIALAEQVVPRIVARDPSDPIRIWVPGCCTGEEAYSLAILFREALDARADPAALQIFATDIDERSLSFARAGSYPPRIAESVAKERLDRFFVRRGARWQVTPELRETCMFAAHNLVSDPPFSRLDLVSCRNVLIYLGAPLQQKLVSVFHYALRPNGYLFLGPSENIAAHTELFRPVSARHRISQRKPTPTRTPTLLSHPERFRPGSGSIVAALDRPDLQVVAQRIVLDEFSPSYVLVGEQGQILVASARIERYLEIGEGPFRNNVVSMVKASLRSAVRPALAEAIETRRKVVREKISTGLGDGVSFVTVVVQPMPRMGESEDLFMIVFEERGVPDRDPDRGAGVVAGSDELIDQLERELATTRDDLERSIQDLEAANQELKSSNEELLSMNEELQSANEELETSKEEIQAANEALARTNADLENLLASSEVATIFLDDDQRIQRFTPAVDALYHVLPVDLGRPLGHITHRVTEMPPLPDAAVVRSATAAIEHEVTTEDGRIYLRRVLPYRTHEGAHHGIVVTFIELTDLRRSGLRLQAALAAADEAKSAAEGASKAKSEFLANMSHEIRTPMTAILGYAEVLAGHVVDPDDLSSIAAIRRNGEFLVQIINDILDLSKIEAGKLVPELVRFDPNEILEDVDVLMCERARDRGLDLRVHADGPLPVTVHGDPTRLRQVLVNLISNAIKFSNEGRIDVSARCDAGAELLEVSVTDTGIGMEPELQARLFEPFSQADSSVTRRYGGTGLGLAISKRLVETLGGTIEVTSAPGAGSTFRFTIPTGSLAGVPLVVTPRRARPSPEPTPPQHIDLTGRHVLLVDDRRDVRYLFQGYLEDAGAEVLCAGDGRAALERFEGMRRAGSPPDAIVLDMQMPVLDGYETTRELRARGYTGVVVALTAAAMKGDREKCLAAGCDAYLSKPVQRAMLLECIARQTETKADASMSATVEASPPVPGASEPDDLPVAGRLTDRPRVLVVDDHADSVEVLAMLLERIGYDVRTATTGRDALATAAKFTPHAVLLDLGLPDLDGYAVLSGLREMPPLAACTFVALSGRGGSDDLERSRDAGFHHHLVKPADLDALKRVLPSAGGC